MNIFIKTSLHIFLLLFISNYVIAQNNKIEITGILIEKETSQSLPYATILIKNDSTKQMISGTTSDNNGKFTLKNKDTNFYLEISIMGFETKTISRFSVTNGKIDLGTIRLSENNKTLDEVIVTADISKTIFKLDKRVFNVGKDISSSGASALEVLNNVPSVNVSIEGDITLRGSSGVQILINGKPSVLADQSSNALGTITADMIESIEIITNPSAKYEASGTGGILNIILKKEEKKGLNGSISVNTGLPDNHSLGLSLNRRTEKFNLFTQLGAGYRSLPQDTEVINRNLIKNESIFSNGTEYRNETFFNFTLGTDYHINDLNVLTLSGNFAYEIEDQPSETNFSLFDSNETLISSWLREETTEATNPKFQYEFNYTKQFENNEEHVLQFSALGSSFGKDLSSQFSNTTIAGDDVDSNQQIKTDFKRADYTFKVDYTNPLSDAYKIEIGAQYVINDVGNDYEQKDLTDAVYIVNHSLTNNFEYNQKVLGIYTTGAYEKENWGIKAGLRLEQTNLNTLLTNTNESNEQNFINFFPTLHTSYMVSSNFSLQLGYSKRIFRPRSRDLNPFLNIRNNINKSAGNPNLQPEFTNSYELTSIYKIGKASLSSSIYHKYTTDVVERISTPEDDGSTISTPENIGSKASIGFETNGKYSPNNWLTLTGDFNFNYFDRNGIFQEQYFDFTGNQWSSRLGSKIGLPEDVDIELTGNYRSGYETLQGNTTGYASLDMGVRKKIFKGKAIVNLGVRDLFESRISEQFLSQPTLETYSFRQRGRFITLGISYGFGKGEAMTYSGGRRR